MFAGIKKSKNISFIITTYFSKSKRGFILFVFFLFFVTIVLVLGSTWNEENQFPDSGPSPGWTGLHWRDKKIPNHCFCKEESQFPWTMDIHGSCKLWNRFVLTHSPSLIPWKQKVKIKKQNVTLVRNIAAENYPASQRYSWKNQSIGFESNSIDCFLYDGTLVNLCNHHVFTTFLSKHLPAQSQQ